MFYGAAYQKSQSAVLVLPEKDVPSSVVQTVRRRCQDYAAGLEESSTACGVTIIFAPPPGKHSLHSLITVLIHSSGHFGPPLPFWAPAPGIAGAADGYSYATVHRRGPAAAKCYVGEAENARHENARNAIVWNTECCICLSIAEQECMSRQERAPDFAAESVLVND